MAKVTCNSGIRFLRLLKVYFFKEFVMKDQVPYLCGGILLCLILQAKRLRKKARNKFKGGTDGLRNCDVMKSLVYVVTGEEPDDDRREEDECPCLLDEGPSPVECTLNDIDPAWHVVGRELHDERHGFPCEGSELLKDKSG